MLFSQFMFPFPRFLCWWLRTLILNCCFNNFNSRSNSDSKAFSHFQDPHFIACGFRLPVRRKLSLSVEVRFCTVLSSSPTSWKAENPKKHRCSVGSSQRPSARPPVERRSQHSGRPGVVGEGPPKKPGPSYCGCAMAARSTLPRSSSISIIFFWTLALLALQTQASVPADKVKAHHLLINFFIGFIRLYLWVL